MLRERCQRTGNSRRWFPSGAQYGSTCMCVIHSLNGCPDSLRMGCASCFWWGGCRKTRCAGGTCRSEYRKPSARSWGLCGISSWLAALAARLVETLTSFASRTARIGPAQTPRPRLTASPKDSIRSAFEPSLASLVRTPFGSETLSLRSRVASLPVHIDALTPFEPRIGRVSRASLSIRQDPPRTATADGHRPPQPIRSFACSRVTSLPVHVETLTPFESRTAHSLIHCQSSSDHWKFCIVSRSIA